jgi:methylglutaconyl-CoA hydratase
MSEPCVLIDAADSSLTTITLNRPDKRNALSVQLMEELHEAVLAASQEPQRRVLILRGNGPAFCAGLDLREASIPGGSERSAHALADLYKAICLCPLITIAAAQGAVLGGGVGLLSACDLVVAADNVQIGFPEVRRGLVAALVTALVRRQLSDRVLRELVLLGQTLSAAEALAINLVNRVVPAARLMDETMAIAKEAMCGAPGAIARTKQLLDDLQSCPVAMELDRALEYHLKARVAAEAVEGIAAFLEKREPRWGPRPE